MGKNTKNLTYFAKKLVKKLINLNMTISSVESVTGGLFIASLIKIPGASKIVMGGLITYKTDVKISLLNINKKIIDKYGVVSKQIANLMVEKSLINSDITVSFTGNAGPKKEKGIAQIGRIYVAIKCYKLFGEKNKDYTKIYFGSRNFIIKNVIIDIIKLILKFVK